MSKANPVFVGLITRENRVNFRDVKAVAGACHAQGVEDYTPRWGRPGTMQAFEHESQLPLHFCPAYIQAGLDQPGALGYHTDQNGQPVLFIDWQGGDIQKICQTVSHEYLESLGDPLGSRLVPSWHPVTGDPVMFLLENCDPPEARGYSKGGLTVSDFILQEWYDKERQKGVHYTFCNSIDNPRQLLPGGYSSFLDAKKRWWQQTWFRGSKPIIEGPFNWNLKEHKGRSMRSLIDESVAIRRAAA